MKHPITQVAHWAYELEVATDLVKVKKDAMV